LGYKAPDRNGAEGEMSNLLEHLKEMKSQAELVDAWQKAFDVAIDLCTDLQKENEHLEYERGVAQGNVTLQMDLRAIAERGLFTLKEECDKLTAKIERLKLQKKDLEEQNYNLTEACCEEREKYDKLKERVEGECIWADQSDIEMDGTYETSCDNMWAFTEDGIKENGITYCPFCGKRIVELTPEEMENA
jgi:chromosome segregation ATPase